MKSPTLYLAGPVHGLSYEEAVEWRKSVTSTLGEHFICFSPLRNKEYLAGVELTQHSYEEHLMSTERAIMFRDMFDVSRADGLFINLLGAKKVSIGTMMELAVAWQLRKPTILIMEKNNLHQHAMVRQSTPFIVESIDDAIDVVRRIFLL